MTVDTEPAAAARRAAASLGAWVALGALLLIGLYTYMDRPLLTLLTEPMRSDLGLSDFQIGLVQGLSWALFAALLSYPIAWLADRSDRRWIIAGSLFLWGLAAVGCALARDFQQLFAASALIGVAEAALLPITYTLIPELFEGRARVLANALVIALGRFGSGLVYALCGVIAAQAAHVQPWLPTSLQSLEPWRIALVVLALPAPIFAAVAFALKLKPVQRPGAEPAGPAPPVWPFLSRNLATLAPFALGVGLLVFAMSALMSFLPVVAMREMGASPTDVANGMGMATLVAMALALAITVGGGPLLSRRFGARHPIVLLAVAIGICTFVVPAFLWIKAVQPLFWLIGAVFMLFSIGAMAFPTALQELTPQPLRTRLISIVILVNMIMSGLGQPAAGLVSDVLGPASGGLMRATVSTGALALLVSTISLLIAARGYPATLQAARAEDGAP
jgi:MFS family permease